MTQANIPLLTGPVNVATLGQTLYALTLAINASGIGSAPIVPPPQPLRGSFLGSLNDFILSVNAVTAAGTVALLARPISPNDLRNIVNAIILQINSFVSGGGYTGPLDIEPGAVVGCSQRALSAAMLGSQLYALIEDAGNTTQAFNSDAVTGDAPISAISAFLNGANGIVDVWNDQSGNGFDLNRIPDESFQEWKVIEASAWPGIGGSLGGGISRLQSANEVNWTNGVPVTIFWAVYIDILDISDGDFGLFDPITSAFFLSAGGKQDINVEMQDTENNFQQWDAPGFPGNYSGIHILETEIDAAGNAVSYLDGIDLNLVSEGGPNVSLSDIVAGFLRLRPAGHLNGGASYSFEFLMYATILSAPKRLAIRQNIASYYGITLP